MQSPNVFFFFTSILIERNIILKVVKLYNDSEEKFFFLHLASLWLIPMFCKPSLVCLFWPGLRLGLLEESDLQYLSFLWEPSSILMG